MQIMLSIVADWCWKWRLVVNQEKTQIVHFRQKSLKRSSVVFSLGSIVLTFTDRYKYLGLMLDEHMTFKDGVNVIAQSAGRALGSLLNRVKSCDNLSFHTFTQLYN